MNRGHQHFTLNSQIKHIDYQNTCHSDDFSFNRNLEDCNSCVDLSYGDDGKRNDTKDDLQSHHDNSGDIHYHDSYADDENHNNTNYFDDEHCNNSSNSEDVQHNDKSHKYPSVIHI